MITLVDGTSGGRALPRGNWPKGVGLEVYSQALLLRNVSSGLYAHIHTHSIQVHTHSIQAHTHKPTWNFRSGQHAWSYFCVFTWAMFWVSSWGKPRSFVLWPSPSRVPWSLFLCYSYQSKTLDINDWSHQEAEWNEQRFPVTLRRTTEWMTPTLSPGSDHYGCFIPLKKIGKPWHCLEQLGWLTRPS